MESSNVSAVLFAKDLKRVAAFYSQALGLACSASDEHHWVLDGHGFHLIVHQIPEHTADEVTAQQPPERRIRGAIRLDFPVQSIEDSRRAARLLGGQVDDVPPEWADRNANFFLGHDPEGNVFGASQRAC
ncbi:MAG TPA: VOC family protein [Povalibacter sp.]|uniref:VOC family protein n=1 Tax=Povalibacter sp. TaxID=1962978 RepID=UPI002BD22943|nr:VOC family protein [Povalibacter sp.]HMN46072.1 VOC family protein [Povalibacter sp.]